MSIFLIIRKVNMQWIIIRYESYLLLWKIILRLIERAHACLSRQPPLTKNEGEGFVDNHQYQKHLCKNFWPKHSSGWTVAWSVRGWPSVGLRTQKNKGRFSEKSRETFWSDFDCSRIFSFLDNTPLQKKYQCASSRDKQRRVRDSSTTLGVRITFKNTRKYSILFRLIRTKFVWHWFTSLKPLF